MQLADKAPTVITQMMIGEGTREQLQEIATGLCRSYRELVKSSREVAEEYQRSIQYLEERVARLQQTCAQTQGELQDQRLLTDRWMHIAKHYREGKRQQSAKRKRQQAARRQTETKDSRSSNLTVPCEVHLL